MMAKASNYFKVFIYLAIGLFIYSPALFGTWIWDDTAEILENAEIKGTLGSLVSIWFNPSAVDYYPLKTTVQWIEWHVWGPHVLGYHLVSIFLHILSALLVWKCLQKLGLKLAWWGGLFFLIHPLAVESVAWISELKNTLSLPLLLLAWNSLLDNDPVRDGSFWITPKLRTSLIWFTLAMLAKASVIMFPFTYLVYVWWKMGRITWVNIKTTIPFFAVALILGLVTIYFQQSRVIVGSDLDNADVVTRIIASSLSILFYFNKIILPQGLEPVYTRWSIVPIRLEMIFLWIIFIGLILFLYKKKSRCNRSVLFGIGFFGLNLAPVLGIIPMYFMRFSWVSDHLVYISLIGIGALITAAFDEALVKYARYKRAINGVLILIALIGIYLSFNQDELYKGGETFWKRVCLNDPKSWAAHYNLAVALQFEPGRQEDALKEYKLALNLTPDAGQGKPGSAWHANLYARVHTNMGGILRSFPGTTQEVMEHYRKAVALDPKSADTHFNLAVLYQDDVTHKLDAIYEYEQALRYDPNWVEVYYNLGNLYSELGDRDDEAERAYRSAIRLNPNFIQAHYNLGSLFARSGHNLEQAVHEYEQVTRLNPQSFDAYLRAASVYQTLGNSEQAIRNYESSLRINYASFQAHFNLGLLLAKTQNRQLDAITHYQQALTIEPLNADTHYNLANLLSSIPSKSSEAVEHYKAAMQSKPDFPEALYNLAILLSKDETKLSEAITYLQSAIELKPDVYFMHYRLGLLYARNPASRSEAIREFQIALKLNPSYGPAKEALSGLR